MELKSQIKDGFCEVKLKSEFKINQSVKFRLGITHPIYSDNNFVIKNIKFNEEDKTFRYLLETKDCSRFWQNQEDIQDSNEVEDRGNFYFLNEINMNNISEQIPLSFNTSDLSVHLEETKNYYKDLINLYNNFKEFKTEDFSSMNLESETNMNSSSNNFIFNLYKDSEEGHSYEFR